MFKPTVLLGSILILSACGGGSGDGVPLPALLDGVPLPTPVDDSISVQVAGRVADAVTRSPLAGVALSLAIPGSQQDLRSTTTDANGRYVFSDVPGSNDIRLQFDLPGYRDENYQSIDTTTIGDLTLEAVNLVSEDNAGQGTMAGQISNALNGEGVPDASLDCRRGINTRTGEVVARTSTDVNGRFLVDDIEYGNLTCEIASAEFVTAYATVLALGNMTVDNQNSALSPKLGTNALRIVLTWGESPGDLDSHLTGPVADGDRYFHVYFGGRNDGPVNLDVDDVSSFGPETVTIDQQVDGVYRYTVLDFNNRFNSTSNALANSNAQVSVFNADGLAQSFFVPAGTGDLWTVFDLRGSVITPINSLTTQQSNDDFFPPEARADNAGVGFRSRVTLETK